MMKFDIVGSLDNFRTLYAFPQSDYTMWKCLSEGLENPDTLLKFLTCLQMHFTAYLNTITMCEYLQIL